MTPSDMRLPFMLLSYPILLGLMSFALPAWADEPSPLKLSDPVFVLDVRGFGDYDERPDSRYREIEKVLIYYEVEGMSVRESETGRYYPKLIQAGRLYRKGRKTPILDLEEMFVFQTRFAQKPRILYLISTLTIEGLDPGDYRFAYTLSDGFRPGAPPARGEVSFSVVKR